jgi:hypothetical protein
MKTTHLTVLLLSAVAFAFTGCASAKKQTEAGTPVTAAPAQQAAPAPAASGGEKVSCAKGSDTRVLEVVTKGAGCALDYTKAGKMSAVSTSQHGEQHCKDSQKKIRAKLEQAGYQCS